MIFCESQKSDYLKWKITWEIEKFNFFKNLHVGDFVFGSDHHLVVHRRHSYEKSEVYYSFIIIALKLTVIYLDFIQV